MVHQCQTTEQLNVGCCFRAFQIPDKTGMSWPCNSFSNSLQAAAMPWVTASNAQMSTYIRCQRLFHSTVNQSMLLNHTDIWDRYSPTSTSTQSTQTYGTDTARPAHRHNPHKWCGALGAVCLHLSSFLADPALPSFCLPPPSLLGTLCVCIMHMWRCVGTCVWVCGHVRVYVWVGGCLTYLIYCCRIWPLTCGLSPSVWIHTDITD